MPSLLWMLSFFTLGLNLFIVLEIIFEDSHYIAIDKPPGFHVHPPENSQWKVPRDKVCLYLVRNHLNAYVYPIHRLDAATGGVLLFAKQPEAAGKMQALIQSQAITKKYLTVLRGWCPEKGELDKPLLSDSSDLQLPSLTVFQKRAQIELPQAVGKKHASARYSLVHVEPKTGRYHQIRRHFASESHPVIGDIKHGDSHHNRFFRNELELPGLLLHSFELSFQHPYSQDLVEIKTQWSDRWKRVFQLFNYSEPATS
jgi:tRNA pseudouridine65 synthase